MNVGVDLKALILRIGTEVYESSMNSDVGGPVEDIEYPNDREDVMVVHLATGESIEFHAKVIGK